MAFKPYYCLHVRNDMRETARIRGMYTIGRQQEG